MLGEETSKASANAKNKSSAESASQMLATATDAKAAANDYIKTPYEEFGLFHVAAKFISTALQT